MNRFFTVVLMAAAMISGCAASTPAPATSEASSASSGGQAAMVQLDVHNTSSSEICYLYISPVSDTHWGPDVLGNRTLSPGETDHYEMTVGAWDFKAEDCSHHELFQMRNQTVAEHSTLTLHD
jgi:hypothetical protein